MERAMSYNDEGGKKISARLKGKNIMKLKLDINLLSSERKRE